MKVKFNKFERVAGLFVLFAMVGAVMFMLLLAIKQGWLERKIQFFVTVQKAEGIFPGTKVQIAGLKVGKVEEIEFRANNDIVVHFHVMEKYVSRIKVDSNVKIIRPFIIGDKILDISLGGVGAIGVTANTELNYVKSFDIFDTLGGGGLGEYFDTLSNMSENIKYVAEAFLDKKRTRAFVQMFDELQPFLVNANKATTRLEEMAHQMTTKNNLGVVMRNLRFTTTEINKSVTEFSEFMKEMPELGKDTKQVMQNLSKLTTELNKLIPTIAAIAPELPEASKQAIEALSEAVVVLKAMQKSFLLSGSAEEVREEEAERKRKMAEERAREERQQAEQKVPKTAKEQAVENYDKDRKPTNQKKTE